MGWSSECYGVEESEQAIYSAQSLKVLETVWHATLEVTRSGTLDSSTRASNFELQTTPQRWLFYLVCRINKLFNYKMTNYIIFL